MFPELVTRPDLELFLPPIGGQTVYLFGDVDRIGKPETVIACRVHDECNGSDVFGSDICTCRPYLAHGVEVCAQTAQRGGVGLVVYNRKEGRALGEVTKFLVYNARKRQRGGDTAETYFQRTECVAGVPDMRFQELMPDVFHWLGVARIDRWVSMSNMKAGALRAQGIEIVEQVAIPDALVPPDAHVEIAAKKAAGYFAPGRAPSADELRGTRGRAGCMRPRASDGDAQPGATSAAADLLRPPRRCANAAASSSPPPNAARPGISRSTWIASTRRSRGSSAITRRRYPDLDVPFHSRWRHFSAGGVDRAAARRARR